ncbi:MAG: hypothetical protein LUG99_12050 [Lachnospiraceae bacterium]|nr:hypothetical protein [Lachnospiraceae bacterium]
MQNYNKQTEVVDDNTTLAILLHATAIFYPLLADYGAAVDAPILVYLKDESAFQDFVEGIGGKMHEIHTTGDLPKEIRRLFANEKRATYFFRFSCSRYVEENLQQIQIASQSISDVGVRSLVFIIATKPVPEKYFRYFAGNILLQKMDTENFSEYRAKEAELIAAAVSGQNMIRERIREISEHDEDGTGVFPATVACLEVALRIAGFDSSKFESFVDTAESIIQNIRDHWELSGNPDAYVVAFRNAFVQWIDLIDTLPVLLDRRKVEGREIQLIGEAIFYDEVNYYLPMDVFYSICAPMVADVGINYAKNQLVSAGLLTADSGVRNYFTRKLEVVTVYGILYRVRRVCLDRYKLDGDMEWSFLELIQSKERGTRNAETGDYFGNSSGVELPRSAD